MASDVVVESREMWMTPIKEKVAHWFGKTGSESALLVSQCGLVYPPTELSEGIVAGFRTCPDCWQDPPAERTDPGSVRVFDTGATRDTSDDKYDYEGFLSPAVLERFGAYMHANRKQRDGSFRDSDNWQKGIPKDQYIKSAWRHFFAWWKIHRGGEVKDEKDGHSVTVEEAICGVLFNAQGYLHEELKDGELPISPAT